MRLTFFGFKGVLFYLTMLVGFYAAPYSNLFFLLLAFLTVQWVLCALWTLRNMSGVTAALTRVEPAPAGAGQTVGALVAAPGRARFQVTVELQLADGRRFAGQADVVDGEARATIQLPPLPRGLHAVRRARVASTYPLGLFCVRRAIECPAELVVYPAPRELTEARSAGEALGEILGDGARGPGALQPSGLRDHREGDELRAVHWRASARRGSLVVRELEGGAGEGLEVLVDRRCAPGPLEEALSTVSALVRLARENKEAMALHSQGLSATFGSAHRPWPEALRFLAGADPLPADAAPPPPVSPAVTRLPLEAGRAR